MEKIKYFVPSQDQSFLSCDTLLVANNIVDLDESFSMSRACIVRDRKWVDEETLTIGSSVQYLGGLVAQ